MPRKLFLCNPVDPYNLAARSHNKNYFPIPIEEVWQIMSDYLCILRSGFDVRIHSFVLMSNHFHMIASFPQANLSEAMQYFIGRTSRHISAEAGHINQIYGNRCYRSQITTHNHFMNVYKYNYRNPVEANICKAVEDYKYSTLNRLLGGDHQPFPIEEDTILFGEPFSKTLNWLNREPVAEHRIAMKNALRRKVFQFAKVNRKPHLLNSLLY